MLFGHNTNVTVGGTTYHVQTEDSGTAHALIDTTVYFHGRVLHRRTFNYFDLLPLNPGRDQALKLRLDEQHRNVVEEIRSGALSLALPPDVIASAHPDAPPSPAALKSLVLDLINPKSWLSGKRATLQFSVRDGGTGATVEHAYIVVRIDGAADPAKFVTETGPDGRAQLEFDMPHLAGPDAALIIEATKGNANALLHFQLRAKPRVPSAS